jgi:pectate lyase
MRALLFLSTLLILSSAGLSADGPRQPAFTGAQGFGAFSKGGKGGAIVRVTSLSGSGAGSLREALAKAGPRIVVFEVSGVIDLEEKGIVVTEPYLTVAGATAPAPGITLIRGGIAIATHNVVVQHIAVRPGEAGYPKKSGWSPDGLSTNAASQVIVDHCSLTWAVDENLSASGPMFGGGGTVEEWRKYTSHDITFSNCIIAEGLSRSTHEKGEHSKGTLLHDNTTNISIIGNLYASNLERSPMAKGGTHAVIVNNWIANAGRRAIHLALGPHEWVGHHPLPARLAIVGNVMEHGPDTVPGMALFSVHYNSPVELYLEDNVAVDRTGKAVALVDPQNVPVQDVRPPWPEGLEALPPAMVKEYVAKNAGARPWDRDPIDARIVRAALEGKGKIIDSEQEVGGYPKRPEKRAAFVEAEWDLDNLRRKE